MIQILSVQGINGYRSEVIVEDQRIFQNENEVELYRRELLKNYKGRNKQLRKDGSEDDGIVEILFTKKYVENILYIG